MERELVCVCKNISSSHLPLEKNIKRKKVISYNFEKSRPGSSIIVDIFPETKRRAKKYVICSGRHEKKKFAFGYSGEKKENFHQRIFINIHLGGIDDFGVRSSGIALFVSLKSISRHS
jgi:hypothetical protein